MLLRWTRCKVSDAQKEAFEASRATLRGLRYVDGLVVRVGGYAHDAHGDAHADVSTAQVMAFWRDEASLERFERLVEKALPPVPEGVTVHTDQFEIIARSPGQRPRLFDAMSAAEWLRIDESEVDESAAGELLRAQLDVWTTGMAAARGMFGGVFAQHRERAECFVRCTGWESEELHASFEAHHLPALRQRAEVAGFLEQPVVHRVRIESDWTVIGV